MFAAQPPHTSTTANALFGILRACSHTLHCCDSLACSFASCCSHCTQERGCRVCVCCVRSRSCAERVPRPMCGRRRLYSGISLPHLYRLTERIARLPFVVCNHAHHHPRNVRSFSRSSPDVRPSSASSSLSPPSPSSLRLQPAPGFSPSSFSTQPTPALPALEWDVVVVGGGHNGLVSAAYLAGRGLKVAVLERRHVLGGAAVTEETFPGYKYSRASYLFSLFRPQIVRGQCWPSHTRSHPYHAQCCADVGGEVAGCLRLGAEAPRTEVLLPRPLFVHPHARWTLADHGPGQRAPPLALPISPSSAD